MVIMLVTVLLPILFVNLQITGMTNMIKVEWNKEHSWKVTKQLDKDGKVIAMKFKGVWYYPRKDYSGRDYIGAEWYIGSDVCHNCVLQKFCKGDNPIWNACSETDELEINWI